MSQLTEFLESGILELYVMGAASNEEVTEVDRMAAIHPEIRQEIDRISQSLEDYARAHAVKPKSTIKTHLLATVDFIERINNGEELVAPPIVTPASRKEDFDPWLNRSDMVLPDDFNGAFAKIIGANLQATTAVVWFKDMSDYEIHTHEHERFLILEGSCDFIIGDEVHSLVPGDYIAVPLNTPHMAKVTSDIPCKAILQRLAA